MLPEEQEEKEMKQSSRGLFRSVEGLAVYELVKRFTPFLLLSNIKRFRRH